MNGPERLVRREISVGGVRVAFAHHEGPPGALPPVLAVHGFGTTGYRTYRHIAGPLADRGITLLAPDLPGFGDSDAPDVVYSLDFFADLLAEFVTELAIPSPVLLGHSMGGKVAIAAAIKHPERFSGLALVNPGGFAATERFLPFVASHPFFHKLLQADWFYYRILPRTVLGVIFNSEENRQQMARLRTAHGLLDLKRTGYRDRLRELDLPGLVIWGRDDRLLPLKTTRAVVRAFPRARLDVIPHAGHAPMKDQPERFVESLAKWLGDDVASTQSIKS